MSHSPYSYRFFSLLFILFLLSQLAPAQPALGTGPPPSQPVVARVYFSGEADLNSLAQVLDIWEVHYAEGYLLALLTPQERASLVEAGYRVELDAERTGELNAPLGVLPGQVDGIPGYPCYRTVEETYADMKSLAVNFPNLAEVIDIGNSWDKATRGGPAGYNLNVLRLTNESRPGPKPVFFLMAEIHAREYATAELALRFGEWLVQNYGVDADATWLLDYYEVHIAPMTNPDGRKMAETSLPWRKNTDNDDGCSSSSNYGVDLNRNHSFMWGGASAYTCGETYQGPSPASEPETRAIQGYVAGLFPDQRGAQISDPAPAEASGVFLTLHSYSRLVLFPWGWSPDPSPNDKAFETLGRKFGYFNGYEVCQSGEKGCIYETTGTSDDWAYGELGVAAYTFELGTRFFESCDYFNNTLLPGNLPALLYAFKAARRPYLDPSGPETPGVAVSPSSITPGGAVRISAAADDTRYNSNGWGVEPTQPITAARFSIDSPSWVSGVVLQGLPAGDGTFDTPIESLSKTTTLTCLAAGRHTLFVESQDSDGNWGVPGAAFFQVGPGSGIGLDRAAYVNDGQPGQTITYTLGISNQGNITDTFTLDLQSTWPASAPANTGPQAPCSAGTLTITIAIPPGALPGESHLATLTLTSQADPAKSAAVTLFGFVPSSVLYFPAQIR